MTSLPGDSRVLLVTRNLPPLVGGMERLNWHLVEQLTQYAEVRVIAPQGSAKCAPHDVAVTEVPLRPLWRFLWQAMCCALREARLWRPTLVIAGSGLTAPAAFLGARASGARAAVYAHGLDLTVAHPIYKCLWLPVLRRMDRVIANSRPTKQLALDIGIDSGRLAVVHPGVEFPPAKPEDLAIARFRDAHQLAGRPLLLSVGRLSERKGLREFVIDALPRIAAVSPDVLLLVVGGEPSDALHARPQAAVDVRAIAEEHGVGKNLRFLGRLSDEELAIVYSLAHVHVFPVRGIPGDPEGFGMVAIEAAAHGLPTVAFASGGVTDAVAEGRSGRLVAPGDYVGFAAAVLRVMEDRQVLSASSADFARLFSWHEFGRQVAEQLALSGDVAEEGGR